MGIPFRPPDLDKVKLRLFEGGSLFLGTILAVKVGAEGIRENISSFGARIPFSSITGLFGVRDVAAVVAIAMMVCAIVAADRLLRDFMLSFSSAPQGAKPNEYRAFLWTFGLGLILVDAAIMYCGMAALSSWDRPNSTVPAILMSAAYVFTMAVLTFIHILLSSQVRS